MKFHEFDDFLSQGNQESAIERLRKAQAEVRRIKRRRVAIIATLALLLLTTAIIHLLTTNDKHTPPQPRRENHPTGN